ncbi:uncharacterized protein LOC125652501 isoform X2 [Ostrea edulis]|uniref:uncharacterized protein LOC125652501 isoform X2 n=1 Tax=Ostrea edulis TaxID=37623 RepID=UPI0024AF02A3|nr:uncharacterized protein LOC125652501 isoform X2 [Ostrea edulis]
MMAQFVDENYWMQRAEEEAKENRMLKHQHGAGACVMFALDTSSSMQGTAFEQMKKVFTDIIDEYARGPMDENVAVVTFGEDIKFVHYYSNNYRSIRKCLDDVECKGASPIEAAIKMCLSGLCLGGGHTASIGMFELRAKLILITDGKPTSSNMIGEVEDKDIMDPVETRKSLMNFVGNVGRHTALNCIPVGEDPDFCLLGSISYSSRGGRLIQPEAAVQYGRYHFNMKIADEILSLGIMPTKCSRDHLELTMHSVGIKSISTDEDLDDILEMINEREAFKPLTYSDGEDDDEGENCEYNSQMPPVGTRVRRGPDWRWGNQDQYGPGTVVSHSERFGWLRVVWDAGASFPYRYGRNSSGHLEFFDLIECDEPRVLNNELIAEGCLVERGADWQWEEQDGGRGNIGVVYKVKYNAVVYVRWPNANKSNYRFGYEGKFDVRLCDPYDPNVVKRLKQQREAGDKRDSSDDTNNITSTHTMKLLR